MAQEEKANGWFWTMFGGTIIGLMGILIATILTYLQNNLSVTRTDISCLSARMAESDGRREMWKEKSASMEAAIKKLEEKAATIEQTRDTLKSDIQGKYETNLAAIETVKESVKELRAELKVANDKLSVLAAENKVLTEKVNALTPKPPQPQPPQQ